MSSIIAEKGCRGQEQSGTFSKGLPLSVLLLLLLTQEHVDEQAGTCVLLVSLLAKGAL